MKTLNKFRSTDQFCITGTAVEHMMKIHQFCTERQFSLVAVGFENDAERTNEYNIRVIKRDVFGTESAGTPGSVYDLRVKISFDVREIERVLISEGRQS